MSLSAAGGWGGRTTWRLGNSWSFWHVPQLRWLVCLRLWSAKLQRPQWRQTKLQRTLGFLGWYASWRIHPWGRYGQLAFQYWLLPRRRCPLQSSLHSVSPQSPLQSPLRPVSPQSPLQSPLLPVSPQSPLQSPLRSGSPRSPLRSLNPQSPLWSGSPQSPPNGLLLCLSRLGLLPCRPRPGLQFCLPCPGTLVCLFLQALFHSTGLANCPFPGSASGPPLSKTFFCF